MKRSKKITRTWKTKSGQIKSKTYEYRTSGRTLVTKGGKINLKKINEYKHEIDTNANYTESAKRTLKNQLDMKIQQAVKNKSRMTERTFESKIANTKIEKYIINLGYDPTDLANELNISEEDLLSNKNWNTDIFTYGGQSWQFTFTYEGSAYERV